MTCEEVEQPEWLPVEPLLRLIESRGGMHACGAGASDRRSVDRARIRGTVRDRVGDRLAVALLGLHPFEVWGDAWWTTLSTDNSHAFDPSDARAACGSVGV